MQFRVPQFIDIEDKILGPLTWKQTAYVLGAVGVIYIVFRFIDTRTIAFIVAAPIAGVFLALAFVKINNRPFVEVVENAFKYYTSSTLYTWKKAEQKEIKPEFIVKTMPKGIDLESAHKKSLKDVAMGLDINIEES